MCSVHGEVCFCDLATLENIFKYVTWQKSMLSYNITGVLATADMKEQTVRQARKGLCPS